MSDNKITTKVKPNSISFRDAPIGSILLVSYNNDFHVPYLVCPRTHDSARNDRFLVNLSTGRYLTYDAIDESISWKVTHIILCGNAHITIEEM